MVHQSRLELASSDYRSLALPLSYQGIKLTLYEFSDLIILLDKLRKISALGKPTGMPLPYKTDP